jgi:hypothetical protein
MTSKLHEAIQDGQSEAADCIKKIKESHERLNGQTAKEVFKTELLLELCKMFKKVI